MKACIIISMFLFLSCQPPQPVRDMAADEAAIRDVIDASQIAWNNGDLEGFMESYWKSDSLQFYSKRGQDTGWQETLESYRRTYSDLSLMGSLHFEILSVSPIAEGVYIVLGKYTVTRKANTLEGSFTLLFKQKGGKWVAVYDHTC